jgi:hypothetical protein
MRGNYEYVVYYGLWLAKVNVLSILPWDKIINFFLHMSCVLPILEFICFSIRIEAFKIWMFLPMLVTRSFGHFGYIN